MVLDCIVSRSLPSFLLKYNTSTRKVRLSAAVVATRAKPCKVYAWHEKVLEMNLNETTYFMQQNTHLITSVSRCVIPCAFFGKSVKHTFSCRIMYPV